ncbi:Small-conductance mechanosensitive channel [Pseudomonas delhiensis]|uniref:Small-conductance mechanosensitive channel n=1 Tax=Pseudomonas delhiensis TaxID=366289 RepID=A0A239LYJ3_9PSED|nr:mechanosensitive ion channel family protein [Pseudomonas delhiensis]SDI24638.1 Small-conductance mechanosensitive channel [Pseudomonas delhiensis]SNT34769.1 Small-conductance mechanosensitive channel [Pseudomonas delhiensis]
MAPLNAWLDLAFLGHLLLVIVAVLVAFGLLRLLLGSLRKRLEARTSQWARYASAIANRTSNFLLFVFSLMLALKFVAFPANWEAALAHGWFVVLALQVALWLDACVRLWTGELARSRFGGIRNPVMTTLLSVVILIVVWAVMLLSILANLGVDITALVASLGVGGIAVALAVQTLLSDVFASLSIGFDKPFEIGDFIVFGDVAGTIEHIGLKTTRIRSLSGEQIVCSNTELLKQTLHNYKRMNTRRIVFQFGISYRTSADKAKAVAELVKEIIDAQAEAKFDRAHFLAFDESRLLYEVVYIMQTADYNRYMDVQQQINLRLLAGVKELGVDFAFPVRELRNVEAMPTPPRSAERQSAAAFAHPQAQGGSRDSTSH